MSTTCKTCMACIGEPYLYINAREMKDICSLLKVRVCYAPYARTLNCPPKYFFHCLIFLLTNRPDLVIWGVMKSIESNLLMNPIMVGASVRVTCGALLWSVINPRPSF